jgi:hypothetical protein
MKNFKGLGRTQRRKSLQEIKEQEDIQELKRQQAAAELERIATEEQAERIAEEEAELKEQEETLLNAISQGSTAFFMGAICELIGLHEQQLAAMKDRPEKQEAVLQVIAELSDEPLPAEYRQELRQVLNDMVEEAHEEQQAASYRRKIAGIE